MRSLVLLVLLAAPLTLSAQPLAWETVGAEQSRSSGPPIIRPDGSWLTNGHYIHPLGYVDFGVLTLDAPYGPEQHWARPYVYDTDASSAPLFALTPDTLFTYDTNRFSRSLDGGVSFERLPAPADCDESRLIELPAGLPHAGRLVCGNRTGGDGHGYVTFSDDRGDSWATAFTPPPAPGEPPTPDASAEHLAVVPSGPRAGRLVAAGFWGVATSDDGGATWQPTAHWGYFRYYASGLAVLRGAAPGGGDRLVTVVGDADSALANTLFASDDGGDTWTLAYDFPGADDTFHFVDLGAGRAYSVPDNGTLRLTTDGGASWQDVGVVPYSIDSGQGESRGRVKWAWLGPDGRLYVGGNGLAEGTVVSRGYTWRTAEPVAVSAGEAAPEAEALGVAVRPNPSAGGVVTVALRGAGAVRAYVVDARGRTVAELWAGALVGTRAVTLDTSALAPGVYAVVVEGGGARRGASLTVVR